MKKLTILLLLFIVFAFAEWDVDPDFSEDITIDGNLTVGDTIKVYKTIKFTNDGANSPASGDPMVWTSYTTLLFAGYAFEWKNLSGTSLMELNSANTNILEIKGPINHETYVIRKHVALSGATDDAATNFFTITTTDETGSADGGMYSIKVHLTAGEATAASGAVNTSSVSLIAHWTRIMASAGTGANSAIVEISESASADEGTGAISAVTLTVAETSEFVQQVSLQVNTSGGTFDGFALVELVYSDFTTAPVIQ